MSILKNVGGECHYFFMVVFPIQTSSFLLPFKIDTWGCFNSCNRFPQIKPFCGSQVIKEERRRLEREKNEEN